MFANTVFIYNHKYSQVLNSWFLVIPCKLLIIIQAAAEKVILCRIWLISQQRIWIFIRKFTRLFYSYIYI